MTDGPRVPWKWIFGGVIVTLSLFALLVTVWLNKQTDLDRIEKRMLAMGMDLNATIPKSVTDPRWKLIDDHCPSNCEVNEKGTLELNGTLTIRPDGSDADAVVDEVLNVPKDAHSEQYEVSGLCKFLCSRLILADDQAAHRTARALVHIAWSHESKSFEIFHTSRSLIDSIRSRRRLGRSFRDPSIAPELRQIADAIEDRLRRNMQRNLPGLLRHAREGGSVLLRQLGISIPGIYQPWIGPDILGRGGRETWFARNLDWNQQAMKAVDARALISLTRTFESPVLNPFQQALPPAILDPSRSIVASVRHCITFTTNVRLIAADLDGSAWPEDPFALRPTPLHRAERGGVLIGAWSVGVDGIDQGGDSRLDKLMSLGPANGYPHMTDPPPPSR